jgi:hypothetical protein
VFVLPPYLLDDDGRRPELFRLVASRAGTAWSVAGARGPWGRAVSWCDGGGRRALRSSHAGSHNQPDRP